MQRRILILDNEPEVVETLAELLALDGYLVDTAATGALALEKLQKYTYELILSDLRTSETDGPAFYQALRHHHPPLCQRVVF